MLKEIVQEDIIFVQIIPKFETLITPLMLRIDPCSYDTLR